jgi:hypothetical protein
MGKVSEPAQAEGQAPTYGLCHSRERLIAIASPVDWQGLSRGHGGPGEQAGLALALFFGQYLPDRLVVQRGTAIISKGPLVSEIVVATRSMPSDPLKVVHRPRVALVMVDDPIRWNPLSKIGLETVHAELDQPPQLVLVPLGSFRVGEINDGHPGLPIVRLPSLSRDPSDEVPLFVPLCEQPGFLPDVRVDSYADLQPALMQSSQEPSRVWEIFRVKGEVAPFVRWHPETIEMEDVQRDVPLLHPVYELHDRLLVIRCQERSRQPQTVRPVWRERRSTRQQSVPRQDLFRGGPSDDVEPDGLSRDRSLNFGHDVGLDLDRDMVGVIVVDAVTPVGQVERDVLVGCR